MTQFHVQMHISVQGWKAHTASIYGCFSYLGTIIPTGAGDSRWVAEALGSGWADIPRLPRRTSRLRHADQFKGACLHTLALWGVEDCLIPLPVTVMKSGGLVFPKQSLLTELLGVQGHDARSSSNLAMALWYRDDIVAGPCAERARGWTESHRATTERPRSTLSRTSWDLPVPLQEGVLR